MKIDPVQALKEQLTSPAMLAVVSNIPVWEAVDILTKKIVAAKLIQTRGNQTQAAKELGMNRSILRRHLTEMEDDKNS